MRIDIIHPPKENRPAESRHGKCCAFYSAFLAAFLFTACHSEHENETAADTLKGWEGQNIQVAVDALGPADKARVKGKKKIYLWHTQRPENIRILGGNDVVRDGHIEQPNADHFNIDAPCDLIIVTRAEDGVIIRFKMHGQVLACTQFSDKINAPAFSPDDKRAPTR